jgi:molybdenum cofactor biosynthesis protein B
VVAKEHLEKSHVAVKCFVITVSDTREEDTDQSGQLIKGLLKTGGHQVVDYCIVKDNPAEIRDLEIYSGKPSSGMILKLFC